MITKAIIEKMIDKYKAKVRIPIYDKASSSATATPLEDLAIAIMCTPPGSMPNYQSGDVVFVGFEDDIASQPIILGLLYRPNMGYTSSDLYIDNMSVYNSVKLPSNTNIGKVTSTELSYLSGLRGSIQNQLSTSVSIEEIGDLELSIDAQDNNKLNVSFGQKN